MANVDVLTDIDEVRQAFLDHYRPDDHQELDARNSPDHPETFNECAARHYNDSTFVPVLCRLPSLHEDFAEPRQLDLESVGGTNVSPDAIGRIVSTLKYRMTVVVNAASTSQ